MRREFTQISSSRVYKFFLIWHFLAMLLALVIGLSEGDYSLFLSLFIWTIIAAIAYIFEPPYFILTAFLLAIIEEFLIYQFGGGLQGEAISLTHDFVNALPVFLGIIIGWYLVLRRYDVREDILYLVAGTHGAIIELVFQGIIFNPVLLFLLGGPNFFIYGSILVVPQKPQGEKKFGYLQAIGGWILVFLFLIFGAIVADNLNRSLGYQ